MPYYSPMTTTEQVALVDGWERDCDEMRAELGDLDADLMPDATVNYFNSGSNNPGEIRGLLKAAQNVGVAANHVSKQGEAELAGLAGFTTKVFVDSGAFSEVKFPKDSAPVVKKLISDNEWEKRLGLYLRLSQALRNQLFVVAPDMIGNQKVTLERLTRYADHMRAVRANFSNVIVPVQKGEMGMAEFFRAEQAILGFSVIAGIPMKKDATKLEELVAFVAEVQPRAIHLLGLGVYNRSFEKVIEAVRAASPATLVYFDSARIPALVGWGEDGVTPRKLTRARDEVRAEGHTDDTYVCEEATRRAFDEEGSEREAEQIANGWFDKELFASFEEAVQDALQNEQERRDEGMPVNPRNAAYLAAAGIPVPQKAIAIAEAA